MSRLPHAAASQRIGKVKKYSQLTKKPFLMALDNVKILKFLAVWGAVFGSLRLNTVNCLQAHVRMPGLFLPSITRVAFPKK